MKNFNIEFVIDQDLAGFKKYKSANGYDIDCPFCGGKRKFNVNSNKGFARCAKCGDGKDASKGFNSVKLHAQLTGLNKNDAYKDLMKRWSGLPSDAQVVYKTPQKKAIQKTKIVMPSDLRNSFYETLIKKSYLKKDHLLNLINRGLNKTFIEKEGFISTRQEGTKAFTNIIVKALPDDTKRYLKEEGIKYTVPGFINLFKKNKQNMMKVSEGILVPVRNCLGEIEAFQVRHDVVEEDEPRYTWFSSSFTEEGSELNVKNIHHVGFDEYIEKFNKLPGSVYLTEGALKADVASCLVHRPFIALPGISNYSQLKEECEYLKRADCQNIYLCMDMDYREKKEVAQATNKIISIIQEAGLTCYLCDWPSEYKGIDDYLLARAKGKTNIKFSFTKLGGEK